MFHENPKEGNLDAAKKRYPGKPIRYLVLTHHHWDHTSGARTYGAEGATFVVGKGLREHFTHPLTAPGAALDDGLNRKPRKPNIIEVEGKHVLKDGKREVHAYHIDSKRAIATLIGYMPDASLVS